MTRRPHLFSESYAVDPETDCWIWTRPLNGSGYGAVFHDGARIGAHRASYLMANGPIPMGFEIDHLCRNRACVNPEHLEAVSKSENQKRGVAGDNVRSANHAKTHCPCGHEYTPANTYIDRRRRDADTRYKQRKSA